MAKSKKQFKKKIPNTSIPSETPSDESSLPQAERPEDNQETSSNREIVHQFNTDDADQIDVNVADPKVDLPVLKQTGETSHGRSSSKHPSSSSANINENDVHTIPEVIGILALRNAVVFPGTVIPLAVGRPRSKRLLAATPPGEKIIGVLTQKDPKTNQPHFEDLFGTGTAATVLKMLKMPDGQNSLVVHGLVRFRIVEWLKAEPYLQARIEVLHSQIRPSKKLDALVNSVRNMAQQMIQLSPNIPDEVNVILTNIDDPGALADFLAANININVSDKQELLETVDVTDRLQKLSMAMASQLEMLQLSAKIQNRVSQSIDKTQREYYLQEQLKAIQTELGQTDQRSTEINELREMIEKAKMPETVEKEAMRELTRLEKIPTMSPEFGVLRSYIEWLCELPWAKNTQDILNLPRAKRILNEDHYNLAKVKKRILEFLAVRKLNPSGRSPILCFLGPPGVGKTSLGRSIARSMGRTFIRISLGGIRDEADIRGHRRTYIGAIPGRIIQELRKCGQHNPVFMLDELDKIGQDFRGDPASALLEVLDPEQNNTFTDHYIDQPFDLSNVMFIGTANTLETVPPALRDRLEVLELPGYTHEEKLLIARRYLVPRQLKENGLTNRMLTLKDEALNALIASYTREAGVRELERQIAAVCRATAAQIASGEKKTASVSASHLMGILGPAKYESELAMRTSVPGVATGLAYTPTGGEILFIESTLIPGAGQLILTGQLGEVMKESAQAALSVLKSIAFDTGRRNGAYSCLREIMQNTKELQKKNIHIHVPAGAIPKDGPSAGLAIYSSLASLFCQKPVRADIAMTGEITLRGQVLPLGGVKEKVLAAKRAGIKSVILPERNRKDLHDLPKHAMKGMKFLFVRNVDSLLSIVLEKH